MMRGVGVLWTTYLSLVWLPMWGVAIIAGVALILMLHHSAEALLEDKTEMEQWAMMTILPFWPIWGLASFYINWKEGEKGE